MGVQRSEFDSNSFIDNVTRPSDSAIQRSGGTNANATSVDEVETIDITIDEEDHKKVFGSQSSVPLEPTPHIASIASATAPASPPPAYDGSSHAHPHSSAITSNGIDTAPTIHLLVPNALHDSGLLFNPELSLSSVRLERNQPTASHSSAASVATDSASSTQTLTAAVDSAAIPPLAEIEACKPHPDAFFVAEALEWRVILDQSQLYRTPPPASAVHDATDLFEACNLVPGSVCIYQTEPVTVPTEDQQHPVQLLERRTPVASNSSAPVLQDFNSHRCYLSGKHILSSPPDSIVTVIDREVLARFKENRENDPAVGLTGPETFVRALRILLRVIGNYVHGERRGAPTTSQSLGQKLGWDHLTRKIFSDLGWKEDTMPDGRDAITPPKTASSEPFSACIDLRRNTRAWIELSVWLAFHVEQLQRSRPASSVLTAPEKDLVTRVLVSSASGSIVETIGSRKDHIDGTYRKDLSRTTLEALFTLGASSTTNDQLVKFAYLINMQASNGRRALELFACLDEVYTSQRRTSRILEELLTYERSQGRYSPRDVDKAYEKLHLSVAHLGHDIERESIPIEVIVDNYKARAREVLINSDASEHAAVKDALRVIALHLGKAERLMLALDEDVDMDIEQASKMLDVNPDMDDSTVLAIFDLYVADAPARRDALRHALRAVAEHRKSEYLRHFLRTGEKDVSAAESWQQLPSNDLPAGIDNIGNTCYLNSVLQYFFSITEVRNRVLQAAATLTEPADTYQIDEDRRVGGQLITAREWQRSRRFVAHLGELFHHLIHDNALSVRPERELAYLALVSSRAEELEGEFSSVVDTAAATPIPLSQSGDPVVSVVSFDPAPFETGTQPAPFDSTISSIGESMDTTADGTSQAESVPALASAPNGPPPLPPRPTARRPTLTESTPATLPPPARRNSLMQLGAQQDVSECLDNCMFQLEVALAVTKGADGPDLKPKPSAEHDMDVDGGEESKLSSIVVNGTPHEDLLTGLFLGKTCQRIEADTIAPTNVGDQSNSSGSQGAPSRPSQPQKQTSTHIKHEVFKILPIDVLEEGRDIYDGLDGFFDSDTFVATSGAVQRRSVTLLSAPPLLQVQLQRVQYDRATMRAFKSQAHLELPEAVYMDRYMDLNADDGDGAVRIAKRLDYQAKRKQIQELRSKVAACKDGATFHLTQTLSQAANAVEELARLPPLADVAAQLDEIRAESSGPADTADPVSLSPRSQAKQAATQIQEANHGTETMADEHAAARDVASGPSEDDNSPLPPALSSLIDPGLSKLFRDESKLLREQVKEAEKQIETLKAEMASIWSDEHRFSYRLVAAFMHRGEASHGHYFLNLRGGGPESKWFKYNDSAVSATSLDQVVKDRSGATPYLVTYVREDYVGLIDPICRSIEAAQPQQQEQTSTEDQEAIAATALAGWEGGVAPDAETKEEAAETPRPQVVTDAFQVTAGETAGGKESPIKRARTDDL
ncbi:UCH repeated domain protein [Kalmanozyma brasiliensis GHG001]|uniref:UCH repeated domain protein n=1 Tax=Kalmanozyma brasiliensis (strain GHG001) TaxID=1365824 RepID=UPI002867D92A|nr:UCH repeated domain protein [Kalmanozyma brasiliensis GHG001]EST05202.2 UCH repeated domain protein [Kalmanozyma brasiliensis GHG001]